MNSFIVCQLSALVTIAIAFLELFSSTNFSKTALSKSARASINFTFFCNLKGFVSFVFIVIALIIPAFDVFVIVQIIPVRTHCFHFSPATNNRPWTSPTCTRPTSYPRRTSTAWRITPYHRQVAVGNFLNGTSKLFFEPFVEHLGLCGDALPEPQWSLWPVQGQTPGRGEGRLLR